jgi:uncharacterized iron-regulated membrane protein
MKLDATPAAADRSWPDYRAVWRWHFYAGLFCTPFVLVLAVSGAIYLFKPQIEAWNDYAYDHLQIAGPRATAADQIRAALAALPDSTFGSYELPATEMAASRVIVRQAGEAIRVYIHPETLAVLHKVPDDERFMRVMFRLHGELWAGNWGSMVVELAASWTIIMILTGLYLWWPRQARVLGGVLYPRLRGGSRMFWRDVHSVTGIWISAFALFLLLSGLPWAKSWGNYLKAARRTTGTAVAQQDWSVGSERGAGGASKGGSSKDAKGREGEAGERGQGERAGQGEHGGHGSGGGRNRAAAPTPKDLTAVDRIAAVVAPLGLDPPVVIGPPRGGSDAWSVKSMTANRTRRVSLTVSGTTGAIESREDFADRHWIDRLVGIGIAAHEGALFGWPNQLLGLLTACGLVLMCASGMILWWRRRDQGVLGAPKVALSSRLSWGLIALIVMLGVYLPLFGGTLVAVLLAEWLLLRRIPGVRNWLGLQTNPA